MAEGSHQRDIISGANATEGTRDKECRENAASGSAVRFKTTEEIDSFISMAPNDYIRDKWGEMKERLKDDAFLNMIENPCDLFF